MPTIELWGGPNDGERHDRPAPLPPEWHVPVTKPLKVSDPFNVPTEPISYDVIRYRNTGCKTIDGKAIIFRYEKPRGKNGG